MSRIVKLLAITLVLGGLIFGAVFGAAAALDVTGVDTLGSDSVPVVSHNAGVTDVVWFPDGNDTTLLAVAQITFDPILPAGSNVYVQFRDSSNVIIAQDQKLGVSGATVDVYPRNDNNNMVAISAITGIDITVTTP